MTDVELPTALAAFFGERALRLDGRVWDSPLTGFTGGRVETYPAPRSSADRVPLCEAGGETLLVDWDAPHAVYTSTGKQVASDLAAFETSLLPKLSKISAEVSRAQELLLEQKYAAARTLFEVALRVFELDHRPDAVTASIARNLEMGAVYNDLGICHRRLGRLDEAERLWKIGAKVIGGPPQLQKNLVDLLLEQERFDEVEAAAACKTILMEPEDRAYLLAARAIAADRMGDLQQRQALAHKLSELQALFDDLTQGLLADYGLEQLV